MTSKRKIGLFLAGLSAALTITCMYSTTKALGVAKTVDEMDDSEPEIDETIAICAAFVNDESHLDNVWIARQTNDIYKSQREEVAIYDFLSWYQNGGRLKLLTAGDFCALETSEKNGKVKGLEARLYVADVERRNADFFAQEMMKRR